MAVRSSAAEGLGSLRDTLAVGPLVRGLSDPDATVRHQVVNPLHRLWTGEAEAAVTRSEAVRALGRLDDARAVDDLIGLLKRQDGPDHQTPRQALQPLTGVDYVEVE